jgi:YidC/Oxa1 family membrane protein insertase
MDKRTILAIILCLGVWIIWQKFFIEPGKNQSKPDGGVSAVGETDSSKKAAAQAITDSSTPEEPADDHAERPSERLATIKTDKIEATFSTRGGSLKSLKILKYKEKNLQKKESELGRTEMVTTEEEQHLPFTFRFNDGKNTFKNIPNTDWTIVEASDKRIKFRYLNSSIENYPEITKTYTALPDDYQVDLLVEIINNGQRSIKEQIILELFGKVEPDPGTGCFGAQFIPRVASCFANGELLSADPKEGSLKSAEPYVSWIGINEQYFLLAAVVIGTDKSFCQMETRKGGLLAASLMYPEEAEIQPGKTVSHLFRLFAGPKQISVLEKVKGGPKDGNGPSHLEKAVDFGWLAVICLPLLWLLKALYSVVGNYGIAIILLTIILRVLLLPLTFNSMKSMQKMSKLKPLMEGLKKKYGEDKARMNQEVMNLYKTHKINPLGGCLPMLLQMPIWFALYRMISSSVELYQEPFIPGWINDLSYRDPFFILPVILGGFMFLQQKMTPSTVDNQQAQMMLYIMPVFFTFIMLYLPAGLVLYILFSTALGVIQQLLYNREKQETASQKING